MHWYSFYTRMVALLMIRIPSRLAFCWKQTSFQYCRSSVVGTRLYSSSQTRLFQNVHVEISPSDHGTRRMQSLVQGNTLDTRLVQAVRDLGISTPTPIQSHAIPLLLQGHDVMASAQTGTGKTLMFGLPLAHYLITSTRASKTKTSKGPKALIINPTRELAMQTAEALRSLAGNAKNPYFRVALATGGADVGKQKRQMQNCDILVGTPGRVLQFVDERALSLQATSNVIVDEADRCLDLGFEPQLRRIARALGRSERHTVLCSATFPPEVQRIASDFLKKNYYFVVAGRVGATQSNIEQKLLWADGGADQRRRLVVKEVRSFLNDKKESSQDGVIVFCNTKDEAERVGNSLKGCSFRVVTGDKTQAERNQSLEAFRRGKVQVLVASDVASRGLDVKSVGLVIQAEAPRDIDTYVHRVGRTGRAGAKGRAIALIDGRSLGIAPALLELMEEANQKTPAWLRGMSHVTTTRLLEEEGAINAGGGRSLGESETSTAVLEATPSGGAFSEQDFRSGAEAGSWGAERDKSFPAFDEEAYGSLDSSVVIDDLSKTIRVTVPETQEETRTPKGVDTKKNHKDSTEKDNLASNQEKNHEIPPAISFRQPKPSKGLQEALQRIATTVKLSKPKRKILSNLSKRGTEQRYRFEYLGMFPFSEVAPLLSSNSHGTDQTGGRSDLPKLLMVAEKPSIAEAIARALSGRNGPRKRRGISRALPVFEFVTNAFLPQQNDTATPKPTKCLVTVTSVVGHVFSLGFIEEKNDGSRTQTDPSDYFSLPVVKQEEGSTGKLRVVDHLRALAAGCDHLVLWLDCDAEGENIAHEVIGVTRQALEKKQIEEQKANPGRTPNRRVHRARFSAITDEALQGAFKALVEPDAALSRSVDARQELDLRIGVALTRLLTWRCVGAARRHFSPSTKLTSYGPCQTPALSFCVDRAHEVESFEPKQFTKLHISVYSDGDGRKGKPLQARWIPPIENAVGRTRRRKLFKVDDAGKQNDFEESASFDSVLASKVVQRASRPTSKLVIENVDRISEQIRPPLGLNTVGLLTACSKAMNMSPKQVMNVAEKLYSAGYISYPRTETTKYDPTGFDVRSVLREHASHPEWGRTANYLLRTKYKNSGRPPVRGHDAGDHPPITILKAATRDEVGHGAAWRVYEFISRHFLGSLSDELRFTRSVTTLELDLGEEDMKPNDGKTRAHFQLEHIAVDSVGFAGACRWVLRDIGAEEHSRDGEKAVVDTFEIGMSLPIHTAKTESCATKPPAFLQEHELIELMDENRIGTDASMAVHVTNIVDRGYVTLCDETGAQLRPPRPPRPGKPRPPRQVGRYLVPTSLGMNLIDLFHDTENGKENMDVLSPALLSRPAIRARMEGEVAQIANGELDKEKCLANNLQWFEERYQELEKSLSRQRINEFSRKLCPTNVSLRHWQRLGAFEETHSSTNADKGKQTRKHVNSGRNAKSKSKKKNNVARGKQTNQQKRHKSSVKAKRSRSQG